MSLSGLSNNILIDSYHEVVKLGLSPEFISMLEKEMINRDIPLRTIQVKQLRKIN